MQRFQNALAYFATAVNYECKMFMKSSTAGALRRRRRKLFFLQNGVTELCQGRYDEI